MSSFVEDLGDRLEWLLASSIPNLQLEYMLVKFDNKWAEFDPNCYLMILNELIGSHTMH